MAFSGMRIGEKLSAPGHKQLGSGLGLGLLAIALWAFPARGAGGLLGIKELLSKVAERARETKEKAPHYEFTRTKITLEVDQKGHVESHEDETYRTIVLAGRFYPRLVARNGKPLSPAEAAKEREKEAEYERHPKAGTKDADSILTHVKEGFAKLLEFEIAGQEKIDGRAAYVVSVRAKEGLRPSTVEERVISRIAGRIWIDTSEFEVVKVDLALTRPVRIGWGVLGSVDQFKFVVRRNRLEDGEWVNSDVNIWLQFRILLRTKRVKYEERVSDIHLLNRPK